MYIEYQTYGKKPEEGIYASMSLTLSYYVAILGLAFNLTLPFQCAMGMEELLKRNSLISAPLQLILIAVFFVRPTDRNVNIVSLRLSEFSNDAPKPTNHMGSHFLVKTFR